MSLKPEASTKKSQLIEKASKVLVWDLPVRLFHWLLVIAIGGAWLTAELGPTMMDIHMLFGYSILVLVLFRILWGLVGSYHARFTNFLAGLPRIAAYARTLFSKQPPAVDYLGHNPLGGWMTMVMLLLLAVQATTGLFANDDIFNEGPLAHWVSKATSNWLTSIHKLNFDFILVAAGIHIAAIFGYLIMKKHNLITPMVHGKKTWVNNAAHQPTSSPLWLAALLFLVCLSGVALLVNYA